MTTIVLTRPLQQSTVLAGDLERDGIETVVMPFYGFSGLKPECDIESVLARAEGRRLVVFTSPRAVEFGLEYIAAEQRPGLEYATVGDATRRELEAAGLTVNWQPQSGFTSEDLLAMPELALATQPGSTGSGPGAGAGSGTAIVMCAPGGRGVLKPGLESLGWATYTAWVYQRQWTSPDPLQVNRIIDAQQLMSVWTSTSAILGAEQQLPGAAWRKLLKHPALVISNRIKHHLQRRGASEVSIASGPGNADLLQSIRNFVEHQSGV